jgi:hypothetical protein
MAGFQHLVARLPHIVLASCNRFFCRRDAFTMNMLEIPQGAGSGFVWDDAGQQRYTLNGVSAAPLHTQNTAAHNMYISIDCFIVIGVAW